MSLSIKINNRTSFIQKFLAPIARMGDMCILTVGGDAISSLNKTVDNSIVLYSTTSDVSLSENVTRKMNIPDIKKLIKALECLNVESIDLIINSNSIEYKSTTTKFKFHLIEDGIIVPPTINLQKIQAFEFDTRFKLSVSTHGSLLKSSTFLSDSNKIYISTKDNVVMAELTDKGKSNTDTYSCIISNEYEGEEIHKELPFSFDLFRICSLLKSTELNVSINNEKSIIAFDIKDDNYKLKYISTALVC